MKNILKLTGVSVLAIMATANANAAGYTCEELVEYTSCNPGYYLSPADLTCPDGYGYVTGACYFGDEDPATNWSEGECESESGSWLGDGCLKPYEYIDDDNIIPYDFVKPITVMSACNECPAGSSCAGGDKAAVACAAGTYQPNKKQASCIDAPAGNYVAGTGATTYTACAAGSYQASAGQSSCITCPAGSYCATAGLSAVSGQCTAGTFSFAGASECSTCPEHEYTNANGQTISVPATTVPEIGAGSVSACIIDSDKTFTDIKGTYHFKENCAYDAALFPSCEYYDIFAIDNPSDYDCEDYEGNSWMETIESHCNGDADCIKNLKYNCYLYQSAYENGECEENENGDWVCTADLEYGIKCEY